MLLLRSRDCIIGIDDDMNSFSVQELALPGVLLITPKIFRDERGFFVETYNEKAFAELGINTRFVQDNLSYSHKGVLRGLHSQTQPHAQAKLVRCASGEVFDVVADCNPSSPTYGRHVQATLKASEATMLYVPAQYYHGFCVLSEQAIVEYKVDDFYAPDCAVGVRFDDPHLAVLWPIKSPILSEQDTNWPTLT